MSPKHGHSLCIVKVVKVRSYQECIRTGDLSKSVYEYQYTHLLPQLVCAAEGCIKGGGTSSWERDHRESDSHEP